MNFITFVKQADECFWVKESSQKHNITLLARIFVYGNPPVEFKQGLEKNCSYIQGNACYVERCDKNVADIKIGCLFTERPREFIISQQNLIQLIDTWYDLIKREAEEIIIECDDNNHCTMRGEFKPKIIFMKE